MWGNVLCSRAYAYKNNPNCTLLYRNCCWMNKCLWSCPEDLESRKLRGSRGRSRTQRVALWMNGDFVRLSASQSRLSILKQANYKWQYRIPIPQIHKPFAGTFCECFHKALLAGADVLGLHKTRKLVGMNQCFCLHVCSHTVFERGVGVELAKVAAGAQGLGSGALWWSRAIHICAQNGCSGSNGVGGLVCGR